MTTATEPSPIHEAFRPDVEALEAADALAAKLAAGDRVDPAEIRAVCGRVRWDQVQLEAEVARLTEVLAAKRRVEAGVEAQPRKLELEAEMAAARKEYEDARVTLHDKLVAIDKEYQPLVILVSDVLLFPRRLRNELLPVHVREEIAAIQERLEGMMPQRRDMERTIEKLKRPVVEDAELARCGNREHKEKHRNKIAALNKQREENLRNLERGHEELLGRMTRLQQRQARLRSRYVAEV